MLGVVLCITFICVGMKVSLLAYEYSIKQEELRYGNTRASELPSEEKESEVSYTPVDYV